MENKYSKIPDPTPNGKRLTQLFQSSSDSSVASSRQQSPSRQPLRSPIKTPLRDDYLSPSIPNSPLVKAVLKSPSTFKRLFSTTFMYYFSLFLFLFAVSFAIGPTSRCLKARKNPKPEICKDKTKLKPLRDALKELNRLSISNSSHTLNDGHNTEEVIKCFNGEFILKTNNKILVYKLSDHTEMIFGTLLMIITLCIHLIATYGHYNW